MARKTYRKISKGKVSVTHALCPICQICHNCIKLIGTICKKLEKPKHISDSEGEYSSYESDQYSIF